MAENIVEIPQDLTLVSDEELASLSERAIAEWHRLDAIEQVTPQDLQYQVRLTDDRDRIDAEQTARSVRAAEAAARAQTSLVEQREALRTRAGATTARSAATEVKPPSMEDVAAAAARGATAALVAAMGSRNGGTDLESMTSRATALTVARSTVPAVRPARERQVITAGVDIPGVARGDELTTLDAVVDAFHRRARGMPVTANGRGHEELVVTLANNFEHVVDDRTSPAAMDELLKHITRRELRESLVAGGGWCAPSEIRYDFFNIAGVDGLIDLPSFGVSRGGIKFPTSPSLADTSIATAFAPFNVALSNTSNPWLWTEQDDAATVTGSTNKPCIRVPCPTFNEVRLECYGICLTAGNLTDNAYPEMTQNFLKLLLIAHAHAQNARYISSMVSLATAAVTGGGFAESNDVVTQVLSGLALTAVDYRAKYGMQTTDVLEVVAPYWVKEVLRAGFLWRSQEYEYTSVADAEIDRFFRDRNIRVQWVNDWQVRTSAGLFGNATAMTAWPTSATFMMYAAGTYVLGNGMSLDLGVVRDSVLNAENDHTAAWSEECHLIARVGHEAVQRTITWSVSALTAPAATSAPNL